ncbi:MAG: NUDIX domain-containing protein, partial [Simkaniaceae bacterium]|nr:NUDIX domain-containing protein [Simkaniaceae bacterium]
LEFGETPLVCAARELEEETALCAEEMVEGPWTNDVFAKEGKHYVSLYVIVTKFSGTPIVTEPDKCRVWRWFSWDELPEPLFLSLKNLVEAEGLEKIMRSQVNESAMRG